VIACLLALLSGALYVLAFPGCDIWPLAGIALVPILHALDQRAWSWQQALGLGLIFGALTQALGFRFLIETLRAFSALPLLGCLFVYGLTCLYQAGQQVLFVMLLWLAKRRGRDIALVAPLAYGALEYLYPPLFPSYFAASLHRVPLLLQLVELGGPWLVSMLLVALNAALFAALRGRLRGTSALRPLLIAALLLAAMSGYGVVRMASVARQVASAPKLSVGIVQANMQRLEKREARAEGRRRHIEQSEQLEQGFGRPPHAARAPDLLVWPETALQYVLSSELKSARAMLGSLTTPVLFGGLGHRVRNGHAQLYNSAFLADADGRILGRTDKMRLIPFAEYIPFGDRIPRLYDLLPNSGQFTTGDRPRALLLHGHRIAALICYEDVLPGFVRQVMRETDAQLLVNLSNDAWFGRSQEPYIHLELSKLRAIEQRRYLVRASNSGISAVIDPAGRVRVESKLFARASLRAQVALLSGPTPYRSLGDWPGWLAVLGSLGAVLAPRRRRTH
jgi:apolipoprotein N-acyltransferase